MAFNPKDVDLEELMAYRRAYGSELVKRDYFKYVVIPGLLFCFLATILLYNPIVSVVFMIIGLLYGYTFFMPKAIEKTYNQNAFAQRNKFINNMTQIMTDESKTVATALNKAIVRADGEFKDDLMWLSASLVGADVPIIQNSFEYIADKYEDDVIFGQYLEQVETATIEGNVTIDTLKDIRSYHNQIKTKTEEYEKAKGAYLKDMRMMMLTVIAFIFALTFSFGFNTYLTAFAWALPGWVASTLYLVLQLFFFKQFSTYLFDDSVTSVKL